MEQAMKIEKEYYAQAVDPETKLVRFQSANKDKKDLEQWYIKHLQSGKFVGLKPVIKSRYLVNGKVFHVKHINWTLVILTLLNFLVLVCILMKVYA